MVFWKYFKLYVLTGKVLKDLVGPSNRGNLRRSLYVPVACLVSLGIINWGTKNHGIPVLVFYLFALAVMGVVGFTGGSYIGFLQRSMEAAGHVDKAWLRRVKTTAFLVYFLLGLLSAIGGFLIQGNQGAIFGGLLFAFFVISKGGVFLWTAALLPAIKATPAALGGAAATHYFKKVLEQGEKKKSTPETPTTEPTPIIPPAIPEPKPARARARAKQPSDTPDIEPAPIKRTRKKATPPPPS